jgi:hypothetical protein
VKAIPILAMLAVLVACSEKDEPTAHIYRYPEGAEPLSGGLVIRSGQSVRVDHHNHALPEPEDSQHWELQPGAFLLMNASGQVLSTVPALYSGL